MSVLQEEKSSAAPEDVEKKTQNQHLPRRGPAHGNHGHKGSRAKSRPRNDSIADHQRHTTKVFAQNHIFYFNSDQTLSLIKRISITISGLKAKILVSIFPRIRSKSATVLK